MSAMPFLPILFTATIHAALGVGLGLVYFRGLWWNATLLAGGSSMKRVAGLMLGRFVLLAIVLALTGREGALPLLATVLGLLIGRQLVVRHVRRSPP